MIATLEDLRVQRAFGLAREEQPLPGTMRAYEIAMRKEFGPGVPTPTLASILNGAFGARAAFSDSARIQCYQALRRTAVENVGSMGGFVVPVALADQVIDQAHTSDGPLSFCRFIPSTTEEFWLPATAEASRANGKRWGGLFASWGLSETNVPAPVSGTIGKVLYKLDRLLMQTKVSNDLLADTNRIQFWLDGCTKSEMRWQLENALINGSGLSTTGSINTPLGLINEPSAVAVSRNTGGTIKSVDIDKMWSSVYAGCRRRAVWHCSTITLDTIDQLAVSGQWPEALWLPRGLNPRWPYATDQGLSADPPRGLAGIGLRWRFSRLRLVAVRHRISTYECRRFSVGVLV